MDDLPNEISVSPVPYISLVGLDAGKNKCHASIWNNFATNRAAERPILYYKLIDFGHKYPPVKPKRSYDRYEPEGIIKKKWLHKHLFEIPSVVAVFEQLDWNTLRQDNVRETLVKKINSIKPDLNKRQIKIVLILLQTDPVPILDDIPYRDQATKLCDECDINPKSLFIIPINDEASILGYVLRIELAMNELAKNHYAIKSKMIKTQKDQLNKSLHNSLFVRYEFKLGFYHEIRQINNLALGHYKNSYANLLEIRLNQANISEIKNVAGLLNYKIVRLCFYLNIPLDAISYFKRHVDIFQNKFISEQIEFEHYAWLSKQYFMFAELFEMAINLYHLSPSTGQNPGTYYFEAATYTIKRRQAAQQSIVKLSQPETNLINEILAKQSDVEFIGQFPWSKPGSSISEEMGFKILQYAEQLVDLTPFLLNLYHNVLNQIKKFKRPRFMRYVMFLIGEEYYNNANYDDAMNYFCNILIFYREEKWKLLHKRIAFYALKSAYSSVDYMNFIKCGFELISNELLFQEDKSNLVNCLLSYLNLIFHPFPLDLPENQTMDEEWRMKLNEMTQSATQQEVFINVDHQINFMNCKVVVNSPQYTIEDEILISVWIFSQLLVDLPGVDLQIKFESPQLDDHCCLVGANDHVLRLNSLNHFEFKLKPLFKLKEKLTEPRIKIIEVSFIIKSKITARFQWAFSHSRVIIPVRETNQDAVLFNKIDERTVAEIKEMESRLEVKIAHSPELFVGENAWMTIKIESRERYPVRNLRLSLKAFINQEELDPNYLWFRFCDQSNNLQTIVEEDNGGHLLIDKLEPTEILLKEFVVRLLTTGTKFMQAYFQYDLLLNGDHLDHGVESFQPTIISSSKTIGLNLNVVEPFLFSNHITNYSNPETANIRADEPFRLHVQLKSNHSSSDWIEIHDIVPQFSSNIVILSKKPVEFPILIHAQENVTLDDLYLLSCSIESSLYSLGSWLIKWNRKANDDFGEKSMGKSLLPQGKMILSETIFTMPSVMISPPIIYVELSLPEKVYARNPLLAKYKIYSRLDVDVMLDIGMGSAEFFMMAGNQQITVNLQSKHNVEQSFIFFPLTCGRLVLPKIDISVQAIGSNPIKIDYINQMIASTIFVLPKLSYQY